MKENKVDETIECICGWIQESISSEKTNGNVLEITEMTKALAELISARVKIAREI